MGNFTESQILILILIAISNIVLIIVAITLLFSGKKTVSTPKNNVQISKKKPEPAPKPVEEPRVKPKQKEIDVMDVDIKPKKIEEPKKVMIEPDPEPIKKPRYEQLEETFDTDYSNYSIDEYSDEEYKYGSIEEFENAQEENAIISYQELMKLKNQEDYYVEPEPKPIYEEKPKASTYSNSNYGAGEFISPVFGRMSQNYEYTKTKEKPVERREQIRYNNSTEGNVSRKTDSNTEFLNALKEFRNNL